MTVARLLHVALVLVLFGSALSVAAAACVVAWGDRQERLKKGRADVITRAHLSAGLTSTPPVISPARRAA